MNQRTCVQCGAEYTRPRNRSHAQWAKMRFCSASCANTWRAQQQRPLASTQHAWATAWERHRNREDKADLARWDRRQRRIQRATQPLGPARLFTAGYCQACGDAWVYYAKRAQSPYCAPCAATRRSRPGTWRAKQHGARTEPIIPQQVFKRDQWRCQICGRKTKGYVPALRAPTLDHIVPLSQGGSHTYDNLQCACYRCNCHVKRDSAVNEQLLLVG